MATLDTKLHVDTEGILVEEGEVEKEVVVEVEAGDDDASPSPPHTADRLQTPRKLSSNSLEHLVHSGISTPHNNTQINTHNPQRAVEEHLLAKLLPSMGDDGSDAVASGLWLNYKAQSTFLKLKVS